MDKNPHRPPIAKRLPTNRITPSRKKLQSFLATPLKSLCWRLNPQTQHEASRKGWDIAQDGCIVSRARGVLSFFSFFQPLAGIERKRGWRRAGKCLSTTAFNPFLTPRHRQRGMGERENREHTHTHTACATSIQRHQGPWRDARNGNSVAVRRLITEFQGDGSGKGMVLVL